MMIDEIYIELKDEEWPLEYIDNVRNIVRAVVFDDEGMFYFVRVLRDDDFGKATLIETSGGGVEKDEDLPSALKRELREELGAEVDILGKIGIVSDYYNLIHRHNINNYFLCRAKSFKERHLTLAEERSFHLSILKLSYAEAIKEYRIRSISKLGKLIAKREVPILLQAKKMLEE